MVQWELGSLQKNAHGLSLVTTHSCESEKVRFVLQFWKKLRSKK